jgi:hypothetical protein
MYLTPVHSVTYHFSSSAALAISFKFLNSVLPVALHNYSVSLTYHQSLDEQTYGVELGFVVP